MVASFLVVFSFDGFNPATASDVDALITSFEKATTSREAGTILQQLSLELGEAGFESIRDHSNPSISIHAEWKLTSKLLRNSSDDNEKALAQFNSKLAKAIGESAPDWWLRKLAGEEREQLIIPNQVNLGPDALTLEISNASGSEMSIERSLLANDPTFYSLASWTWSNQTCVIGVFEDFGVRYEIAAVDVMTKSKKWQTRCWALGSENIGAMAGEGRSHVAEIEAKDGKVFVWGSCYHGSYLEVYDLGTGEALARFSTCLWCSQVRRPKN